MGSFEKGRASEAGEGAARGVVFEEAETSFTKGVLRQLDPITTPQAAQYDASSGAVADRMMLRCL